MWKVAPYGLTNMPAIYSRAIMHFLQGLQDVPVGYDLNPDGSITDPDSQTLGEGAIYTWIDDITVATGSAAPGLGLKAHCEFLKRAARRLIAVGMTLKGSKCDILHQKLKVLGFVVTRDGIQPNPDKVEAIQRLPYPRTVKELQGFLGMVNFNRRFVYDMGGLTEPLNQLLRKGAKGDEYIDDTPEARQAFEDLKAALSESCSQAHPDLTDPAAEFVIMTDASAVAMGGTLMQWQKAPAYNDCPLPATADLDSKDTFASAHAKRLAAGYCLRVIAYFSKTFDKTQRNWATFDKESAAVLAAVTHWHRLIVGRSTAVYTDSTVAASILSNAKVPRPAKLERWSITLGTYLPNLRLAYRMGKENYVADHMSRFYTHIDYEPRPGDEHTVPDDLYEQLASCTVHNRRTILAEDVEAFYRLISQPAVQPPSKDKPAPTHMAAPIVNSSVLSETPLQSALLATFVTTIDDLRNAAGGVTTHWEQYTDILSATIGRKPVLYVVGSSPLDSLSPTPALIRGAEVAGAEVHYFDRLFSTAWWEDLAQMATVPGYPTPDMIHIEWNSLSLTPSADQFDTLLSQLQYFQLTQEYSQSVYVPWTISAPTYYLDYLPTTTPFANLDSVPNELGSGSRRLVCASDDIHWDSSSGPVTCSHLPSSYGELMVIQNSVSYARRNFGIPIITPQQVAEDPALALRLDQWGKEGVSCASFPAFGHVSLPQFPVFAGTPTSGSLNRDLAAWRIQRYFRRLPLVPLGQSVAALRCQRCYRQYRRRRYLTELPAVRLLQSTWRTSTPYRRWAQERCTRHHQTRRLQRCWQRNRYTLYLTQMPAVLRIQRTWRLGRKRRSVKLSRCEAPRGRKAHPPLAPPATPQEERTPPGWKGPWTVTYTDQLKDPELANIDEALTLAASSESLRGLPEARRRRVRRLAQLHTRKFGRLYRLTDEGLRLLLPQQRRFDLLRAYHCLLELGGHRGAVAMYSRIARIYFWDGMYADCETFVQHCEVCHARDSHQAIAVRHTPLPDPPHPFHTIYIDYKTMPRSANSEYKNILIVVCGLTRFTIAIPTKTQSAEETAAALIEHVFTTFSVPLRIVPITDSVICC